MARRSGRFKAVDEDGDEAMGVEGMLDVGDFPSLPPFLLFLPMKC